MMRTYFRTKKFLKQIEQEQFRIIKFTRKLSGKFKSYKNMNYHNYSEKNLMQNTYV